MNQVAQNDIVNLERFWLPAGKSYSLTSAGWLERPHIQEPVADELRGDEHPGSG